MAPFYAVDTTTNSLKIVRMRNTIEWLNKGYDRQKTSAIPLISELRKQRRAFFFRRSLWKKTAFSFVTFLLAKQKKSKIMRAGHVNDFFCVSTQVNIYFSKHL